MRSRPIVASVGLAIASFHLLWSASAAAQAATEPSAIERTIPREAARQTVDPAIRTDLPAGETGLAVRGSFVLGAVHVSGATVLSAAELAAIYEPYLATQVDDARLKELVAKITARYRDAGYPLAYAFLPPQEVRGGVIRIDVIEGRIGSIEIAGAGNHEPALAALAAPLLAEQPVRTETLERAIGRIRALPGFYIIDVRIARNGEGLADHRLLINVLHRPVSALAYADNRGTVPGARVRLYSSHSFSSLMATGDELRVNGFAIPADEFHFLYGQLAYTLPLGTSGWLLNLAGSYGDQYQLASGRPVDGRSTHLSAQLTYPLVTRRSLNVEARLAISDWRTVSDQSVTRLQRDRLRVIRTGLGVTHSGAEQISAEIWLARGIGFDAATRPGDPLASRPDAGSEFTKASFRLQSVHPLSGRISLRTSAAGQYSSRPVLSVEEFALGGAQIGRGYDFSTLVGDHGLGGGLELGYRLNDTGGSIRQAELFAFIDGGAVFQRGDPVGWETSQSLISAGGGARFVVGGFNVSAEAGVPIRTIGDQNSVRLFVSASKAF